MATVATIDFDAEFAVLEARLEEDERQRSLFPLVRLWTGDWEYRGTVTVENSANFQYLNNETGIGRLELPEDYYLSEWLADHQNRAKKNVHITVDKDGARWDGRMESCEIVQAEDGTTTLVVLFKHSYEEVKYIYCLPNPFLPFEIQFPRLWLLFGPARWALSLTLLVNVMRLESSLWMLPDDPMDPSKWFNFDQSTWSMVVKPFKISDDNSNIAIVSARGKQWHEVAKNILADAQLTVVTRRYLDGDPAPWPGANLRHGCLVISIEDKSGWRQETSFGGNLFTGLQRAFTSIASDGLTEGVNVISDPTYPDLYKTPGFKGSLPVAPWVIYRHGDHSGIETSSFIYKPATAVQWFTGGHSMPGVNELISAGIQMAGDLIAAMLFVPPVGGAVDAVLKPLYCVAGGTVIDGPDGNERIDVLAERGKSFRVWSVTPEGQRVSATVPFAFKKGQAELFEYTLSDGRTLVATKHHRWLTRTGWTEAGKTLVGIGVATADHSSDLGDVFALAPPDGLDDSAWASPQETAAVSFAALVSVRPVGVQDFYDMHVPGWVNYSSNGIWSHNTDTILAWMGWKSPARAQSLGWSHYKETFADGADRAYTLSALIALRAAMWETREQYSWTLTVADGAPYRVGEKGFGHFWLGDRIGSTIKGQPIGRVYVDQVTELNLGWDRDTSPGWKISVGHQDPEDPVVKAFAAIQNAQSSLRDLGVL